MPKKYIKYRTEESVKKALKIESFRNLSKDKIMQFASMIPYVDKEVALAIIEQFPQYVEFCKIAISSYIKTCDKILENNRSSQESVVQGYQTILDSLSKRLEKDNLSDNQVKEITEDMIRVADKINEADINNKKFLEKMGTKVLIGIGLIVAAVGAGIGISSRFGGSDLPEVEEDEDEYV